MRVAALLSLMLVAHTSLTFDAPSQFTEGTNPNPIDTCNNTRNYVAAKNQDGILLSTKHISDANCIQLNAYENEDFVLKFYRKNDHSEFVTMKYDAQHAVNCSKSNISMTVENFDSHIVYTDKDTGESTLYVRTNLTQLTFTVPFAYDYFDLHKGKKSSVQMWLDTNPPQNGMITFYLWDYAVLVVELVNVMILVDIGIIVVILFRRYNLDHKVHSNLMWFVLVLQLMSLFYFLWRYQFYFWHVPVFFYFFILEVFINIFSISNTSLGVFLLTAILEKHICQNIPVIKRVHRILGYISYALMKLTLLIKIIIFVYVANMVFDLLLIGIILINPIIWLGYLILKITQYYYQWDK